MFDFSFFLNMPIIYLHVWYIYIYAFHVQPQLRGIVATWDLPPEKTQPDTQPLPNPPASPVRASRMI